MVTIRGWLDFEGSVYRDQHGHAYTASIISFFAHIYNARVHTYIVVDPVSCGKISRAARCGEISRKYGILNSLEVLGGLISLI